MKRASVREYCKTERWRENRHYLQIIFRPSYRENSRSPLMIGIFSARAVATNILSKMSIRCGKGQMIRIGDDALTIHNGAPLAAILNRFRR